MAIKRFREEHWFLSNMCPLDNGVLMADGREVGVLETAYQADKFLDEKTRERVLASRNGFEAKSIAKRFQFKDQVPIRPDWEEVKVDIMRWYVLQKFTRNPELEAALLATGNEVLIEGSRKDAFWGVDQCGTGEGANWLGVILMETRDDLRQPRPQIAA